MKKYMMIAALAATLLAVGCTREAIPGDKTPVHGKTTLTATLEPLTKASIDRSKIKVSWNAGDQINVNGSVSNALSEAASTAVFTFDATLEAPYKAVFPASIYKDPTTITLPGELGADGLNLSLVGYTAKGNNLHFSALTTLLQVSINGDKSTTLKEIVLKGLAGEQISGDFTINHEAGTLTGTSANAADKQVKIAVGKAFSTEPIVVFIPVPAGNYASGYQVDFVDSEDKVMRKTVSARTFKAGELREMPELVFEPTITPGPVTSLGGIPDVAEFQAFATAVNTADDLSRWTNASGEIELLDDLDLASLTSWTPIGDVTASGNGNNASAPSGNAFTGKFNGGGHTIRNFKITTTIADGKTFGLFGYLLNATVKNLKVEADLNLTSAATADAGVVAGTASGATIEDVTVTATITCGGSNVDNVRFTVAGIAGFLYGESGRPGVIKNCTVTATSSIKSGANTKNGATCVHYGGIVGFATAPSSATEIINSIEGCTNNGTITATVGRSSGIVGVTNRSTLVKGCTNNASHFNDFVNGRIAQIVCNLSAYSAVVDCVNHGDLTTTDTKTTTGGMVALFGNANCYLEGGTNTGTIITGFDPATDSQGRNFSGIIGANINQFDHVKDFVVSGRYGHYKSDGNEMVTLTSENYMDYIGYYADANASKITNITFVAP